MSRNRASLWSGRTPCIAEDGLEPVGGLFSTVRKGESIAATQMEMYRNSSLGTKEKRANSGNSRAVNSHFLEIQRE